MNKNHNRLFRLVDYDPRETAIFMPNEIFNDLQAHPKLAETPSHLAFAYSYYYFVCYLYRYCKYGRDTNDEHSWTQAKIKETLGYSGSNKQIDYIIKKGGALDEIGYTKTVTDWPIRWGYATDDDDGVGFEMYSEFKKEFAMETPGIIERYLGLDRNFRIKYPVKAFDRGRIVADPYTSVTVDGEEVLGTNEGTFYSVAETHGIEVPIFLRAMSNPEISTTGFYVYGFIKHQNGWYQGPYNKSFEKMSKGTGIPERTLIKYLTNLELYGFLKVFHQPYVIDLPKEQQVPNSYWALGPESITAFAEEKPERRVLSLKRHSKNPFPA